MGVVRIFTEQESSVTSDLFIGAPMELITSPHVQSVSKARKSPQLRSELAELARQGGRGRGGGLGAIDSDPLSFFAPCQRDHLGHTTSVLAVCEPMRVARHNAATRMAQRPSSWKKRACCRAGVRRHQLPPRSERKGTYSMACARKDNYCGQ